MRRIGLGKLMTGILMGATVGATVGWLTSPASAEIRRRLGRQNVGVRERMKTADENVESQVRNLQAVSNS